MELENVLYVTLIYTFITWKRRCKAILIFFFFFEIKTVPFSHILSADYNQSLSTTA